MPKLCIILNPWAGRGTAGQRQAELEAELRRLDMSFDIIQTPARSGAIELAYQALDRGYDCIAAAGGDGTINEVINGILGGRAQGGPAVALGIVPMGTGSDFVK